MNGGCPGIGTPCGGLIPGIIPGPPLIGIGPPRGAPGIPPLKTWPP